MKRAIGDDAAITFAASFYRAIGFGRSVREAFDQGRTALLLEGIREETTPDLMTRQTITPESIVLINPLKMSIDRLREPEREAPPTAPAAPESDRPDTGRARAFQLAWLLMLLVSKQARHPAAVRAEIEGHAV